MNGKSHIHFSDGRQLKQVGKATYLGSEITTGAGRWSELNNRMNIALRTCNKLKDFWYERHCSYKWNLHVYNALIIAQISYGMNTVHLTQAMLNRLDAFQMKGLRYILKIEHAYYSGVSNQEVYDKINIVLNKGADLNITWQEFVAAGKIDKPETIEKMSEYIMSRQNRTFAHVVRAKDQDPMKQMTVTST